MTVPLAGHLKGVTLTMKRLTSADYAEAQQAAQAILRNEALLLPLLVEHDLLPDGRIRQWKQMKTTSPLEYAAFLSGVGAWLGAVECGVRGIIEWSGIQAEDGSPAKVGRPTIEVLMLDEGFQRQAMAKLDEAARILIVEGEP